MAVTDIHTIILNIFKHDFLTLFFFHGHTSNDKMIEKQVDETKNITLPIVAATNTQNDQIEHIQTTFIENCGPFDGLQVIFDLRL